MSRILVTGASGFVGRRLVPALIRRGHTVFQHDIGDGHIARCDFAFDQVDHVYHLAGKVFVPASWTDVREFYDVNVLGTVNVLEYCRRQKARCTLISSYVYGIPDRLPIAEDHPVRAVNPYSHTKLLAEDTGRFYENFLQVPVTIIRPFNLYGPGQAGEFLIPSLLRQAIASETTTICVADENPRRDYLYIDDFVDLLTRIPEKAATGTYNAGSGFSFSVAEIVEVINSLLPVPKPLHSRQEARLNDIPDVIADIRKAREKFGWEPHIGLTEGLARILEAMQAPL